MKERRLGLLTFLPALLLLILLTLQSGILRESAAESLRFCAASVVPALFPFCVLAAFLTESGVCLRWNRMFAPVMRLFRYEKACAVPWLLGMLCGYPVGAMAAGALFRDGAISKDHTEYLLGISANASPGFVISVVGGTMLHSPRFGALLFLVHMLSSWITALLIRPPHQEKPENSTREHPRCLSSAFTDAVEAASLSMLRITGFITLFSVIGTLLMPVIRAVLPSEAGCAAMLGALEITNGLKLLSACTIPIRLKFILASGVLGFSGLCVFCQIFSCVSSLGLSMRPYLKLKTAHAIVSMLLSLPISAFLPNELPESAIVPAASFRGFGLFSASVCIFLIFFSFFYGKSRLRRV